MKTFPILHWVTCAYVATIPLWLALGWPESALVVGVFTIVWLLHGWRPWSPGFK